MTSQDHEQLIIQRLTEAATQDPDLSGYYELHKQLAMLHCKAKTQIAATLEMVDQDALDARVLQGLPLLSFAQLPLDAGRFADFAARTATLLADYRSELAGQPLPSDAIEWTALAETRFNEGQADKTGSAEAALDSLTLLAADVALRPYLEWAAEQVSPHVKQDRWKRNYCPVCGGAPDMSVLTEESGTRQLVCSRCNCQWIYRRIGCPFCETTDHTKISYYPSDDDIYRLYVCNGCQRYLKTVDLRKVRRRSLLELERITTVDLDLAARQEGYR